MDTQTQEKRPHLGPKIGCAYVLAFLLAFGGAVAAVVSVIRATDNGTRVRALAGFIAAAAAGLLLALVYTAAGRLGIPWFRQSHNRVDHGVLAPSSSPVLYWCLIVGGIVVGVGLLSVAAWMWTNSEAIGASWRPSATE